MKAVQKREKSNHFFGWLLFCAKKPGEVFEKRTCFARWEGGDFLRERERQGKPAFMTKWTEKVPGFLGRFYTVFQMTVAMSLTAYADIFDTAKTAMQKVYTDVAGLATVAAVVCAAVCLFLMNFSRSGKTVDESRSWLKRIIVCWAALMTLGAIVTYMESIIPKSMFSP